MIFEKKLDKFAIKNVTEYNFGLSKDGGQKTPIYRCENAPNLFCLYTKGIGSKFCPWVPVSIMNTRE